MACPMAHLHPPSDIHPAMMPAGHPATVSSDTSSSLHNDISEKPYHRHHDNVTTPHRDYLTVEEFMSPDFFPKHMNLIIQESVILGAGAAAILLQVAEAGVAAGVNEHSNFAYRVQDRLRTTMTYVYCMAFGTSAEKQAIVDAVTRVHTQVNGTLNEGRDSGKRYDALDPELQLWVAATLYYAGINIYQKVFGRIEDEALHEKIYREYAVIAISLQVPPEMWPADRRAFMDYFDRKVAQMEITQHARDVARDLLYLPKAPFYLRVLTPSLRCMTAELMPRKLRDDFGIRSHRFWYHLHMFGVKAAYRPLPLVVRSLPVRLYMWNMRKRLGRNQKVFDKA